LIEMARRPWSPIVERAWVALHSSWLIPVRSESQKNVRVWFPLRKLISQARKHRDTEIARLSHDPLAASQLLAEDDKIPVPTSSGPFPNGKSEDIFREIWRKLVALSQDGTNLGGLPANDSNAPSIVLHRISTAQESPDSVPTYRERNLWSGSNVDPINFAEQNLSNPKITPPLSQASNSGPEQTIFPTIPLDWLGGQSSDSDIMPWSLE